MKRTASLLSFCVLFCGWPASAQPNKKRILAIGQVKGFQHDATTNGLATIWKLGRESGLWDTYIRTDTQLITKRKLDSNAKNLDYFDAVVFYTTGELDLDEEQKAALLAFVHEDGKGFIGIHSALDTLYEWPGYGEMIGGYFDGHPWNQFQAPIVLEDAEHPITSHLPKTFTAFDEIYQARAYSREKVRVLLSMDADKLDLNKKGVNRTDRDFAIAWVKPYGNGRVFYSTFGHRDEMWDRADIQKMWLEAVKWTMGMTEGDATPRPKPAQ